MKIILIPYFNVKQKPSKSFFLYPKVAAEIANPLTNVKSLKMVSSGKGDVGVFKLTNEVISIMEKLPVIVESMTGLSVSRVSAEIREGRQ